MTVDDFLEVAKIIEGSVGKDFSDKQIDVWFGALQSWPVPLLQAAASLVVSEHKFSSIPTLGSMIDAVRRIESEVSGDSSHDDAFAQVMHAVRAWGLDQESLAREELSDRAWKTIENVGGWSRFCDCTDRDRSSLYAQFRDAWNSQDSMANVQKIASNPAVSNLVGSVVKNLEGAS